MARSYRGDNPIENPDAYARAIQSSIYARATAKRQREWDAAHPQLAEWLNFTGYREVELQGAELADYRSDAVREGYDMVERPTTIEYIKHPLGPVPSFARDARNKWGSLTDGQTATLQRIYDERTSNAAKREEQRAAERATAQPWTAGRQVVEGVVISAKATEGYAVSRYSQYNPTVYKMLVKRDDGSKVYLTVPSAIENVYLADSSQYGDLVGWLKGKRVRFTATVEPKAEEPTFAFAKRPAKAEIITTEELS